MELILLTIGKTSTPYIREGISEYCRRLKRYIDFSVVELADIRGSKALPESEQKIKEGKLILDYLKPSDCMVLLDEKGAQYTSVKFAAYMQKKLASGRKRIIFVVGGPYGFSDEVYAAASEKLSLSKMTFSHEMVRLFITEQFYRAMTILRGEPYHHQ